MITIVCNEEKVEGCSTVLIAPEISISEPGYIKAFTSGEPANAKHEFQALAQMAYYQYQDGELEISLINDVCRVIRDDETEFVDTGLVVYRDRESRIHILCHGGLPKMKLLESLNRYCTRWVRLDI